VVLVMSGVGRMNSAYNRWSRVLLIHREFSQFFVADSNAEVRDRRWNSTNFILVLNDTRSV